MSGLCPGPGRQPGQQDGGRCFAGNQLQEGRSWRSDVDLRRLSLRADCDSAGVWTGRWLLLFPLQPPWRSRPRPAGCTPHSGLTFPVRPSGASGNNCFISLNFVPFPVAANVTSTAICQKPGSHPGLVTVTASPQHTSCLWPCVCPAPGGLLLHASPAARGPAPPLLWPPQTLLQPALDLPACFSALHDTPAVTVLPWAHSPSSAIKLTPHKPSAPCSIGLSHRSPAAPLLTTLPQVLLQAPASSL